MDVVELLFHLLYIYIYKKKNNGHLAGSENKGKIIKTFLKKKKSVTWICILFHALFNLLRIIWMHTQETVWSLGSIVIDIKDVALHCVHSIDIILTFFKLLKVANHIAKSVIEIHAILK